MRERTRTSGGGYGLLNGERGDRDRQARPRDHLEPAVSVERVVYLLSRQTAEIRAEQHLGDRQRSF